MEDIQLPLGLNCVEICTHDCNNCIVKLYYTAYPRYSGYPPLHREEGSAKIRACKQFLWNVKDVIIQHNRPRGIVMPLCLSCGVEL